MKESTLERRLELLRMEGIGLSVPEMVQQLSVKYRCVPRTVYWDFQTKARWQPQIQQLKKGMLKVLNRHEEIYRKASFHYLQSKDNTKLAILALNQMRLANRDFMEMLQSTGMIIKVADKIEVVAPWLNKFVSQVTNTNHIEDKESSTNQQQDSES